MPRYIVERTFPEGGFRIAANADGVAACKEVVERNGVLGVTWLCSYVSVDRRKTFDVYDAESPEAVRKTARRNELPVDRITQVEVLDPYFCR
jgi:Protein of unknown function (DUF4242)